MLVFSLVVGCVWLVVLLLDVFGLLVSRVFLYLWLLCFVCLFCLFDLLV